MHRKILPAALAASSLLLASCANVPLTETGFLGDYSDLKPAPEAEVWGIPDTVRLYRSPALDQGAYDAVIVDASVWMPTDEHDHRPTDEKTAWLLEELSICLAKGLAEDFEIITTPRPGALRLRPAMTAVDPANVWINLVTLVLLVPVDMGGISGEFEVVDAMTGERVLAMDARREGNPFLFLEVFTTYGQARHGMWKWSRLLAEQLQPRD
ncbi:MAG: hypothetical protein ACI8QS_002063 [Planctomycetota bacterium]|jgi:hypothetical protein